MKLLDADRDGVMTMSEVYDAAMTVAGISEMPEAVKEVMRRLDTNNDGLCTNEDLRRLVKEVQAENWER